MLYRVVLVAVVAACCGYGEVVERPGGETVPHEPYVRMVSETISPVAETYIPTKDGVYVAAAIRKPEGDGPFPTLVQFHGAPGGQGMKTVVGWARGDTGGPMWERYLQEGFVVVVADYRGGSGPLPGIEEPPADAVTRYDDGLAVIDYVRALPYVDGERIVLYGGSYGGDLVLHLIGRTAVRAAGVGAPAAFWYLGIPRPSRDANRRDEALRTAQPDAKRAKANIEAIRCPLLIQIGGKDSLLPLSRKVHDLAEKAGKDVRMEIYANSPHGFYFGPLKTPAPRPMLDTTLAALDSAVAFMKGHTR